MEIVDSSLIKNGDLIQIFVDKYGSWCDIPHRAEVKTNRTIEKRSALVLNIKFSKKYKELKCIDNHSVINVFYISNQFRGTQIYKIND